jgi:hypothetical protein
MKNRILAVLGVTSFVAACASPSRPAAEPVTEPAVAPAAPAAAAGATEPPASPGATGPAASAGATGPATSAGDPSASADAGAAPASAEVVTSVTTVSNEIVTPNVISPDMVIAGLRPKLNACYQTGLKKDPKLAGSVTLSAKIDKGGKVSAVTPKLVEGLSPVVLKCLSDEVKAANFAPSGGMNYTTSIDIPVRFATQ